MAESIRGKQATIQLVVNGNLQTGSFAKVTSFSLKPRTTIDETGFIGETEDELTFNAKGWDFDFQTHEWDGKVIDLILENIRLNRQRLPQPSINIIVTTEYFSASDPSRTLLLENCKLMMTDRPIGGANDFITNHISGKCKIVTKL